VDQLLEQHEKLVRAAAAAAATHAARPSGAGQIVVDNEPKRFEVDPELIEERQNFRPTNPTPTTKG